MKTEAENFTRNKSPEQAWSDDQRIQSVDIGAKMLADFQIHYVSNSRVGVTTKQVKKSSRM